MTKVKMTVLSALALDALRAGVEAFVRFRREHPDLQEIGGSDPRDESMLGEYEELEDEFEEGIVHLDGLNLAGADFSGLTLLRLRFVGANLRGAKFTRATIQMCGFDCADLAGADFEGADLRPSPEG